MPTSNNTIETTVPPIASAIICNIFFGFLLNDFVLLKILENYTRDDIKTI